MTTYVEKVQAGAAVDTRSLVSSIDDSALANLAGLLANTSGIRLQDSGEVQLQALDELVLKLNVGDEIVSSYDEVCFLCISERAHLGRSTLTPVAPLASPQ